MSEAARLLFWETSSIVIPHGYHLVDYIAGNFVRTAYIKTNIYPTSKTRIIAKITWMSGASNGWMFHTEDYFHNMTDDGSGPCYGVGWDGRLVYGSGFSQYEYRQCDMHLNKSMILEVDNGCMKIDDKICFDRSGSSVKNASWLALLANNRTSSGVIEKADSSYRIHRFAAFEDE